jgi:putative ABC transport system permease protein
VSGLLALAPDGRIPRLEMIRVDGWVLAFALAASLVTALLFGLAPAITLTRGRFGGTLLPGGRTFGAGQERLRAALVVGEIALALMLVTGAGLLVKSFVRLRSVDSGFDTRNVVALNVELPSSVYRDAAKLHAFHQNLLSRLAALPGVVSAGGINWVPLGGMHMHGGYAIEGGAPRGDLDAERPTASGGYFRAMGIPLVRGRDFNDRDTGSSERVAIISRAVARAIDRSEDVIGRRVSLESNPDPQSWLTVVGVVGDVKAWGPSQPTIANIYRPYQQVQNTFFLNRMTYTVRTASDAPRLIPEIRAALRAVDRDQPATSIVLMEDVLDSAVAEPAFQARLLTTFAVLALALCIIGTYGVLTYAIVQRTHEIGIRLALGARAASLVWAVVRRTVLLALAGIGLGLAGAALATRLLTALLFEVEPGDPATFIAVTLTIFTAAVMAGLLSARRATRIDPLVALRHD